MNHEIVIARAEGKSSFTADEILGLLNQAPDLSSDTPSSISWTDPNDSRKRAIHLDPNTGKLWTDDTQGDDASLWRILERLRHIANILDARLIRNGKDITFPRESKALRQHLVGMLISWILGSLACLAILAWVFIEFIAPEVSGWALAPIAVLMLFGSIIGGMAAAALTGALIANIQHRLGIFHCTHCGRPLKTVKSRCDCPQLQAMLEHARKTRETYTSDTPSLSS